MNTPAQPLGHRAFLQQYVLAGPFETPVSPEQLVSEANEVWELIEKVVAEEARRRAPEDFAAALRSAIPAPPEGWSQTEPSGYIAKYPTTGEPLATPEVGAISATPPVSPECPHLDAVIKDDTREIVCLGCGKSLGVAGARG